MKICRLQFKLSLLSVCLCLGLLLFVHPTKASDVEVANNYVSARVATPANNIVVATTTIPIDCQNAVAILNLTFDDQQGHLSSVFWHDSISGNVSATQEYFYYEWNQYQYGVYSARNIKAGDVLEFDISFSYASGYKDYSITTFCGVDTDNPFNVVSLRNVLNETILTATSSNAVSKVYATYFKDETGSPVWSNVNQTHYIEMPRNNINYFGVFVGDDIVGVSDNNYYNYQITYSGYRPAQWSFVAMTINPLPLYCGDGICSSEIGETGLTCPDDCLQVIDMTTVQDFYLWFDRPIEYCPINTSCNIKYHFDDLIFNPTTDYAKLYYYATSTSSPEFIKNIVPIANNWELGDLSSGSFTASSSATSTQFSYYQIIPCQTFGACFGTSTVAIWYSAKPDYAAIVSDLWPASSSTSTSDFITDFNMTAYNLTCSAEQWGGDWWTKLGCYFRFGEIVLQKKSVDILNNSMAKTWSALKNIFPFNFASLINSSWKTSKASDTPDDLEFLDMLDDDGSIYFDFSEMTGTTTKLKFWGADTFNNTNGEFTKVRTISKYLFYGLLILYIYLKGKSVYNEFTGNKDE